MRLRATSYFLSTLILHAEIEKTYDEGRTAAAYSGVSHYEPSGVSIWESLDALISTEKARSGTFIRFQNNNEPSLTFKGSDENGIGGDIKERETFELILQNTIGPAFGANQRPLTILDNDSTAAVSHRLVIMAANITSGNRQEYEPPGDRIFQALKPDIVGIQEFNAPPKEPLREWVNRVFGPEFHFTIEEGDESIPCGVISRYPIFSSGEWQDPQVIDRDFAWASIDIPGPTDLHVISVHFHGSGGKASRNIEAQVVINKARKQFPATDYIVLCGDLNTTSRTEPCLTTLNILFSDDHIPVDQNGDPDTNRNRNAPYDWVLPNEPLDAQHVPYELAGQSFPHGLVFDTRIWSPTPAPTVPTDSAASNMQHMAVIKAYAFPKTSTTRSTSKD